MKKTNENWGRKSRSTLRGASRTRQFKSRRRKKIEEIALVNDVMNERIKKIAEVKKTRVKFRSLHFKSKESKRNLKEGRSPNQPDLAKQTEYLE